MRKLIILVLSSVIVLLAVFVYLLINKPSIEMTKAEKEQAMADILGRKPNLKDAPRGSIEYEGKFASFSYPKTAVIYTYKDPGMQKNNSLLESFSFDTSSPKLVFNYTAFARPDVLRISDLPDVRLRQLEGRGYTKTDIKAGGLSGLAFEKSGPEAEKSAFFLANGKAYILVVTGGNIKDVNSLFNQIIVSFRVNL